MKKYLLIILILISAVSAYPQEPEDIIPMVFPQTVYPGDAFMVTIKSSDIPEGMFDGKKFRFFQIINQGYVAIVPTLIETSVAAHEITIKAGAKHYKIEITVGNKVFGVTQVNNLPNDKVFPKEESLKRIRAERAALDEIFQRVTPPQWDGNFIMPIHNGITTEFGVNRMLNEQRKSIHYGIDYKAALDEPIKAVNSGKVVLCSNLFFEGNTTIIDHGAGIYSIYMHLSSMTKKVGYLVNKYDLIGYAGQSGRATGPHLHLSVKINGISVNPESVYGLPLSEPQR